ncbi:SAV_6107 family HEPN domain-containing protein [Kineococcus gynurae]|uniref:SAV_6107 family HEPN domain-containing protein n=1 Tax=Kineococcus gynurae TaxID=452979 RepID=A0ABV5LUD8_9ACTN
MPTLESPPRPSLTPTALDLLERSEAELRAAVTAEDAAGRYVHAHLAALRAAAAVVAVHGRPAGRRRAGPRSVWEMLPLVHPELGGWAPVFAATAARRAALEAGRAVVDEQGATELLGHARRFHHAVEAALGLTRRIPLAS